MQLHHQVYGAHGDPVIILHGLFGSLDNWASISRKLSAEFQVFALDLRNHGRSPHSPEMNLTVMARDVQEFMSAHHWKRAHLVGHSLGGKVAMQLALSRPESVHKLVVVDIAPRAYGPQHENILDALLAIHLPEYKSRQEVEHALASRVPEQRVRRFLVKGIRHEPGRPMEWRMDLPSIANNYPRLLEGLPRDRHFPGPALFIKGGHSDYISPQDRDEMRDLFPVAVLKVIAGAGHWVHAEAPEIVSRELLDFLR